MPTLIVLTGPTASGKTAAALQVAEHFHAPILNADSRQIYRDIPFSVFKNRTSFGEKNPWQKIYNTSF